MVKGFVFTFDAALAAVLAITLLVIAVNLPSINTGTYFGKSQLYSVGTDFVAILDQNNTFDSYIGKDSTYISNNMQNHLTVLPPNYCANVSIYMYSYSSGFSLDSGNPFIITKTGCNTPTSDVVRIKRIFMSYSPEKYGKVEIAMWLK